MTPTLLYVAPKYDYGDPARGLAFEHRNFYPTLKSYCEEQGWTLTHYDFMARGIALGLDAMTQELYDLASQINPVCVFAVLFDFHRDPRHDVFRYIAEATGALTIHWFCDDHWRFEKYSHLVAPHFDFVCTTASSALPKYEVLGMTDRVIKTQWACGHDLYAPREVEKDIAVSFVGMPHGDRPEIIRQLSARGLEVDVFGYGWPDRPRLPFHQMVRLFSRSKVNLNLSNASSLTGQQIKGRNFEVPGTNSFLLTGDADNLSEYYEDGKEIVVFHTLDDLVDKANYYLTHDDERAKIAAAGYRRTLAEHTWHHRYDSIFREIAQRGAALTAHRAQTLLAA